MEKIIVKFIENATDEVIERLNKGDFNKARLEELKSDFSDCNVILAYLVYDALKNYLDIDVESLYNAINDLYIEEDIEDLIASL